MSKIFPILGFVLILCVCLVSPQEEEDESEWWRHATFYQVYPRSFKDSDGDGVGDLRGITSKIPYLKSIGIDAIWLSPMFESPMVDNGYDVSDFRQIHHEFGTMEDYDEMIREANAHGIHIMLDFVPNHSSDKHEWFEKSVKREMPYDNFYTWRDPVFDEDNNRHPPNNWVSVFEGPAWTYVEERGQYYLHQFYPQQPDLNYENPLVIEEMSKILEFWLEKGAAGFRLDAINHMFEDQTFPNEPESGWCESHEYCYLDHIYTKDLQGCYDAVYHFREVINKYADENNLGPKIIMTEAYASITDTMRYYGSADGTKEGASMPFNFGLINGVEHPEFDARRIKEVIDGWLNWMPVGKTSNWVTGSHDHHRVATRLNQNRVRVIMTLLQTLPGVSITYYGEEIGMTDYTDFVIVDSRDPNRTPMQWDNSVSAGFSSSATTWLPVNPNFLTLNVDNQQNGYTNLASFKLLTEIRKEPEMRLSEYIYKAYNENVGIVLRMSAHSDTFYVIILNFHGQEEAVRISNAFPSTKGPLVWTFSSAKALESEEEIVGEQTIYLEPYEGRIYKHNSAQSLTVTSALIIGIVLQFIGKLFS